MTTVYLAEKPSQARDIAHVLGIAKRDDGFITTTDGSLVTWAFGHLLETAEPAAYNESWGGRWNWNQLPMIPAEWKLVERKDVKKQLRVIRDCLARAKHVVIATDAGREGELIARELIQYFRYKGPVSRFWTSSLTEKDIRAALRKLRAGKETEGLCNAALARQRSDWLLGFNGTRAATLAAGVYKEYFPLGRVQTPTLAMVVRRCRDIKNFKGGVYYEIKATVRDNAGTSVELWHSPDEEHRITKKEDAEKLVARAAGWRGCIEIEDKQGAEAPPLPYSLPRLQKDANRKLGFSAAKTLKLAQSLYEKKVTTYPRTDCQYLANSQIAEIPAVLDAVAHSLKDWVELVKKWGVTTRKDVFNDEKLTDHHGIIPTSQPASSLSPEEKELYTLICLRYLQVLSPDHTYIQRSAKIDANGVVFKATERKTINAGWTALKWKEPANED